MATVPISKASRNLSHWVNRAGYSGETVTLTSHGKPKAILIGVEQFKSLLGIDDIPEDESASWDELQATFRAAAEEKGIHTREQILDLIQEVKLEIAEEKYGKQ